MSYASETDLEQRYGAEEIAQRRDVLPFMTVAQALADADAEIDAILTSRYVVPVSPAPQILVRLACAIARRHLLGDSATEKALAEYSAALEQLADLQTGRSTLIGASLKSDAVRVSTSPRLFAREVESS